MEPSFKPYGASTRPSVLRIEVPQSNESSPNEPEPHMSLKEPISIDTTPSPGVHYRLIAQLPTPVTNNGRFPSNAFNIPKRVSRTAGNRVVSDFPRAKMAPPLLPVRHISNPTTGEEESSPLLPSMALPTLPQDSIELQYQGRVFEAPHTGHLYRYEQLVGEGAFSAVVAARDTAKPHELVAIKLISVPTEDARAVSSFRRYICRELGILRALHHPGMVRLLDYNVTLLLTEEEIDSSFSTGADSTVAGSEMYDFYAIKLANEQSFFLHYLGGGNLLAWLKRNYGHTGQTGFWRLMRRVVAEVVVTTAFLHRNLVIHRDIKPENVLLAEDYVPADYDHASYGKALPANGAMTSLTDFGLSKRLALPSQLLLTKCGSHDYVSPELLMGRNYDGRLLDLWALGVLVYCILEDRLPFDAPPLEFASATGVSPSVLKRRQSRNGPAYRIATIDWDWYRTTALQTNTGISAEARNIIASLMRFVEVLLVRKDRRVSVEGLLELEGFEWITAEVPASFLEWRT